MPALGDLKEWAPFHIDALGLVSLLAAESLRHSISRLVPSPYAEYLPLLAPQIFADNTIANPIPGFTLYNITDGFGATDLSAWFTRWLMCQKFKYNSTTLLVNAFSKQRPLVTPRWALMVCINFIVNASLVVLSALLGDWYGITSAISLLMIVFARGYMLFALRSSLDSLIEEAEKHDRDRVTLFLTLPNGRAVTILTTRGITVKVLLTEAVPEDWLLYMFFRGLTWVAFGVLVFSLGSASLCAQAVIVVTMLLSTVAVVNRLGCNEQQVGRRLGILQVDVPGEDARRQVFLNMHLNPEQEEALLSWHLLPMKYNTFWWNRYRPRPESEKEGSSDGTPPTASTSCPSIANIPTNTEVQPAAQNVDGGAENPARE